MSSAEDNRDVQLASLSARGRRLLQNSLHVQAQHNLVKTAEKAGFLHIEEKNASVKKYFRLLSGAESLEYFDDDQETTINENSAGKINIGYITKVVAGSTKSRKEHVFEVHTPSKIHVLVASNNHDRDVWMEVLKRAAVTPLPKPGADYFHRSTSCEPFIRSTEDLSYDHSIVGGVIIKTPLTIISGKNERSNSAAVMLLPGKLKNNKEGWCCKQGAVMKNWKRRYFRLNVVKLSYYENDVVKEPIRSINSQDIQHVRILSIFANHKNIVEVDTSKRKFYMQPDNEADVKLWKEAIEDIMRANGTSIPRTNSV